MNDEIKLKDMIDFLENIYKDIKKRPTLEEELEKERKFINKIKGNNKDEVKELLEHIKILDNTDYILHSDKAKALLDYITNLQAIEQEYSAILSENAELENKITNLQEENERLKVECSQLENIDYLEEINRERTLRRLNDEIKDKYKSRCEKAIKCIKDKYYKEEYERKGTFANKLMNILQGEDKE